jgi:hypothetical protein
MLSANLKASSTFEKRGIRLAALLPCFRHQATPSIFFSNAELGRLVILLLREDEWHVAAVKWIDRAEQLTLLIELQAAKWLPCRCHYIVELSWL